MGSLDRRQFLGAIAKPAAAASMMISNPTLMANAYSKIKKATGDPKSVAKDEAYWREIQQGYTADRGPINLNNGGVSPSPTVVQDALKRYLDFSNISSWLSFVPTWCQTIPYVLQVNGPRKLSRISFE